MAKAQLELKLTTTVKNNKKCFYKCITNRRRAKGNLHLLLHTEGNTVTKDEEKTLVFNAFLASVFNIKIGYPQGSQSPERVDRDGEQKKIFRLYSALVRPC